MNEMPTGFDIIGDIHGHANELKALLTLLGYERHGRGYRHSDRQVVFVGDFIDRGPAIGEVIEIARAMVDAGDALAVMGNHEYNAIAFHTPFPGDANRYLRAHSAKNLKQHRATLDQLSAEQMRDAMRWFLSLPVALEFGGIRVAHAAWQGEDIACIERGFESLGKFTPEFLQISQVNGNSLSRAIENVLKGPKLPLPAGTSIMDKAGHERGTIRIKWYEQAAGRTYREHHLGSDHVPDMAIHSPEVDSILIYPHDAPPIFVGHYWLTGTPMPLAANVACTDYSVAKGGKLVAYRWDGESTLDARKFAWVGKPA